MMLTINGEARQFRGETIGAILSELGLDQSACAVEVNQELVPAREREQRPLADGDAVEIVTLVGGG